MERITVNYGRSRQLYFKQTPVSSVNSDWRGFLLEEAVDENKRCFKMWFPKTTIFLCTDGNARTVWKHRGVSHSHIIKSGTIFMVRRDAYIDEGTVSSDRRLIAVQIEEEKLRHFDPEFGHKAETFLVSAFMNDDKWISSLLTAMRDEIRDGCQSGALYAESLSLTMLSYVRGRYAYDNGALVKGGKLSHTQMKWINDYIVSHLNDNISIDDLSRGVDLSPTHFARSFKSSFGVAPYNFVMRAKIHKAQEYLLSSKLSVSYIAADLGFCSQSHFAKTFRQFVGCTPTEFRRRS